MTVVRFNPNDIGKFDAKEAISASGMLVKQPFEKNSVQLDDD